MTVRDDDVREQVMQVDMKSRFAARFWPHDLLPGDQRPPEGAGIEAMGQFRERINSACTTVRSATVTWIEDGAAGRIVDRGAQPDPAGVDVDEPDGPAVRQRRWHR
jgi:hypothetical protein